MVDGKSMIDKLINLWINIWLMVNLWLIYGLTYGNIETSVQINIEIIWYRDEMDRSKKMYPETTKTKRRSLGKKGS